MNEKNNSRIKAFIWYIITEPIRIIKGIFKPKAGIFIFALLLGWGLFTLNKIRVIVAGVLMLIFFLYKVWDDGHFMHKYRVEKEKRVYKNDN